ncbi:MAG TPA: formylglycine-generating enzyme family protein, partial [Burkholderiaceae bacterium]|nr:formylglycine-generating enzyme family protein [Burkholderiaceae bacterium]
MPSINISRRTWLWGTGATLGVLAAALALTWHSPSSTAPIEPVIIVGDGVSTPKDMAWVPPGVFQMGSDSKLAQANERPA